MVDFASSELNFVHETSFPIHQCWKLGVPVMKRPDILSLHLHAEQQ